MPPAQSRATSQRGRPSKAAAEIAPDAIASPITYSGQLKRMTFATPSNRPRDGDVRISSRQGFTNPSLPFVRHVLDVKRIGQARRVRSFERWLTKERRLSHLCANRLGI